MESTKLIMCLLHFFYIALCCFRGNLAQAVEVPNYTVIRSESDFQIRLYTESSWISALVSGTSFEQSTKSGFHRLYQYMHGANLNSAKIAFTAPALTSFSSSSSSSSSAGVVGSTYVVKMYVSAHFQGKPPQPNPELMLQIEKWKPQCIAVRKFSGYAKDDNISKEIEALVSSINKRRLDGGSATIQEKGLYTIAQYNASFTPTGRVNEVWINVSGLTAEGCPPSK